MDRNSYEQTILNAVTPVAITSSTDATPIVITATTHGLVTGDRVFIQGHTTNIAANGIFKVTKLTANTFSLQDEFTGADVAGSGGGAGSNTGFCMKAPVILNAASFKALTFQIVTANTATTTLQIAASMGKLDQDSSSPRYDFPNFGATQSKTNPYSFVNFVDYVDGVAVAGGTGLVVTGTDVQKILESNTNGIKYVTVLPTTWTAGAITIKAKGYYI